MSRIRFANPTPFDRFDLFEQKQEQVRQFYGDVLEVVVPVATGVVFVATPYVAGLAIVAFAPPWMKPIGVSMLVPGPQDLVYFAAGYAAGNWLIDQHPMFDWIE